MLHILSPFRNPVGYFATALGIGALCAVILIVTGWDRSLVLASDSMQGAADAQSASAALSIETSTTTPESPPSKPSSRYIEIVDSCGPYFGDACVNVRRGPGEEYSIRTRLRNGVVLKISDIVEVDLPAASGNTAQAGDRSWYKIVFDEHIRYPERARGEWYIASPFAVLFEHEGEQILSSRSATTSKRIIVDRSEQMLYAYEGLPAAPGGAAQVGEVLFMQERISTGIELTPTPRGTFTVYKKTPSRYMQGPLPGISDKYYDLPGVPWNLYFTLQGGVIHGTYWHDRFGQAWSNGCVNLPSESARRLYEWAELGTTVIVRD